MALKDLQYLWFTATRNHLHTHIRDREEQLSAIYKEIRDIKESTDSDIPTKTRVFNSISTIHSSISREVFEVVHKNWNEELTSLGNKVELTRRRKQINDRFRGPALTWYGHILKPLKRLIRFFSTSGTQFTNFFRKNKKEPKSWYHTIRLRALFQLRFGNDFIPLLSDFDNELVILLNKSLLEIKVWEESGKSTKLEFRKKFRELEKTWDQKLQVFYDDAMALFKSDSQTVGTIDFRNGQLSRKALNRQWRRRCNQWYNVFNGRANTTHAIFEDWRSDLELSELHRSLLEDKDELVATFYKWIGTLLKDHYDPLEIFLTKLSDEISALTNENGSSKLHQMNYRIKKDLDEDLILPFTQILSKNSLLNHLNKTEYLVEKKIEDLSKEYAVIKTDRWDDLLNPRDFTTISGYELVSFEMAPRMTESFVEIKNLIETTLTSTTLKINDLDEIVSYTLETAETIAEDDFDESRQMTISGLERAIERLLESKREINEVIEKCINERFLSIDQFAEEILQLTNNDNLNQIRFRISKAKAARKSGAIRSNVIRFLRYSWTKVYKPISVLSNKLVAKVTGLRKKILPQDATELQSRLLSDFIISSKKKVEKLPLIYKKLYEISALTDPFLFEGREVEIAEVQTAYNAWHEDKFSAVLLHGEKWSGLTTLINQLGQQIKFKEPVLSISVKDKILDDSAYFTMWSKLLNSDIKNLDELVRTLMEGPRQIIIVENIQNMYLRILNGRLCIKLLLKTIALTQKNIFWIHTSSTYAFHFLQRTHQVSGFYSYVIGLRELTHDQVRNLISKRNRISGFEIIYEPSAEVKIDKKYTKLTTAGQQLYLEKQFYRNITDYARSNISMALNFWLLSTISVDGKRIHIGNYERPDDTFLEKIDVDKLHILHAIVLHDGLNLENLSKVLIQSYSQVEMLVFEMVEDGLLKDNGGLIVIDSMVYRIIITLLKSKNLIY